MTRKWKDSRYLQQFVTWKHAKPSTVNMHRHKRTGQFIDKAVQAQWAAYRQGVRTALPDEPPPEVIEAMVMAGARRDWAKDIYQAIRAEAIEALQERKTVDPTMTRRS